MSRDQVLAMMTWAGCSREQVEQAAGLLPEQVDPEVDRAVLERLSLTAGELMGRMGASP